MTLNDISKLLKATVINKAIENVTILVTPLTAFETAGKLYQLLK